MLLGNFVFLILQCVLGCLTKWKVLVEQKVVVYIVLAFGFLDFHPIKISLSKLIFSFKTPLKSNHMTHAFLPAGLEFHLVEAERFKHPPSYGQQRVTLFFSVLAFRHSKFVLDL